MSCLKRIIQPGWCIFLNTLIYKILINFNKKLKFTVNNQFDFMHIFHILNSLKKIIYILFLACDKGFYGHGCNETCGHCRDVQECSHINETCVKGCDAGYHEELCKTS